MANEGLIQIPLSRYNAMKQDADNANNRIAELHSKINTLEGKLEAIQEDLDEFTESSIFERTFGWRALKEKVANKHHAKETV